MSTTPPPDNRTSDDLHEQVEHLFDDLQRLVRTLSEQSEADVTRAAACGLRALADVLDTPQASRGKHIDELVARLEQTMGPLIGHDPKREEEERQQEIRRSAQGSIAEALREAGITPLTSAGSHPIAG